MFYQARIGLEIHARLKTRTKMFCVCVNDSNEQHPNVNVCPICLGHPGTLPVPNREAIRLVQRLGAALGSELAPRAKFDRKNYFYPDLPKGYQISQYDMPFCTGGHLDLVSGKKVRIRRIHLEEDAGKLLHPESVDYSVADYNRAGTPLLELVTEPDLETADEVKSFDEELQRILRYVGVSDADKEKGEMRLELNLSLDLEAGKEFSGTKVEIKNLNSTASAVMAVAYEIDRQSRLLGAGKGVVSETRGWHDTKKMTFSQRTKEEAHDYRYFPEPDIPPLVFTDEELVAIRAEVPELPAQRRERFVQEYGLAAEDNTVFVDDRAFGDYFEEVISELRAWVSVSGEKGIPIDRLVRLVVGYLLSDLRGILIEHSTSVNEMSITPEDFAELMTLVAQERVTSRVAKDVLREMFSTGRDPSEIIEEEGLFQVSDEGEIRAIVERIIVENPKPVADYRSGKDTAIQFLVGKVMAATQGKANPETVRGILKRAIE